MNTNIKSLLRFGGKILIGYLSIISHSTTTEGITKSLTTREPFFVILTTGYNNASFYKTNLSSIFAQTYKNYHLIYIDDCSIDGTFEYVQKYVEIKHMEEYVTLIKNEQKSGRCLENQYKAIHTYCRPSDIIVIVDGDDALFDENVLAYLKTVYANPNIWMTYGQFIEVPNHAPGWCIPMPEHIVQENKFREFTHIPSHLRTFYAGLFMNIKLEDLQDSDGNIFRMAGDMAQMMPMIEMARQGHFQFISKVLLAYNNANPLSDHRISSAQQKTCDIEIRAKKRYEPITEPYAGHFERYTNTIAS